MEPFYEGRAVPTRAVFRDAGVAGKGLVSSSPKRTKSKWNAFSVSF